MVQSEEQVPSPLRNSSEEISHLENPHRPLFVSHVVRTASVDTLEFPV